MREGIDGSWSTFIAQIGTPAQNVHLLVSTSGSATVTVLANGCQYDTSPSTCPDDRGKIFNPNASSTWISNDIYNLGLEENLRYSANGQYGKDTVALGWQGSGGPTLPDQVVAGLASQNFYLGEFGLTPRPTNFTDFTDPQPSFLETLKNKNLIPSLGWSYTAGAKYRLDGVFGSLILGGYDKSVFQANNVTFNFGKDISRDLTVAVQRMTLKDSLRSAFELLPTPIYAFIDSTLPYLYLPEEACNNFEQTFGIQWDNTSQLYFVDDQQHDLLVARNPEVTLTLGLQLSSGPTVKIALPYAAFDLTATYPLVAKPRRYFPLRRAANDTQYTLGRTFLQEAYLTVDYEHSNFSVSTCLFNASTSQDIVPIGFFESTATQNDRHTTKSTPKGAIIGGAVGGASLLFALAAVICGFLLFRRRRQCRRKAIAASSCNLNTYEGKPELDGGSPAMTPSATEYRQYQNKSELDGGSKGNIHPYQEIPRDRSELSLTGGTLAPPSISPGSTASSRGADMKPLEAQSRPIHEAPSPAVSDVPEAPYHAEVRKPGSAEKKYSKWRTQLGRSGS